MTTTPEASKTLTPCQRLFELGYYTACPLDQFEVLLAALIKEHVDAAVAFLRLEMEDAAEDWASYVTADEAPTTLVSHMRKRFDAALSTERTKTT